MTDYEKLQKKGFSPKFKKGDTVQTKAHIRYYRKQVISDIGRILYLLESGGIIYYEFENDWELVNG